MSHNMGRQFFLGILISFFIVNTYGMPKPVVDDDDYEDERPVEKFPKTTFSCKGRKDGFYADVEAGCRVFYYCHSISHPDNTTEQKDWHYTCPPSTIFRQEYLTCSQPNVNFKCSESESFYDVNDKVPPARPTPPTPGVSSTSLPVPPPPSEDYEDELPAPSTTSIPPTVDQPPPSAPTDNPSFLLPPLAPFTKVEPLPIKYNSKTLSFKPLWFTYQSGNVSKTQFSKAGEKKLTRISSEQLPIHEIQDKKSVLEVVQANIRALMKIFL